MKTTINTQVTKSPLHTKAPLTKMPGPVASNTATGLVYCPICTHTVEAVIASEPRRTPKVVAGQKCRRCSSSIDAGYVIRPVNSN